MKETQKNAALDELIRIAAKSSPREVSEMIVFANAIYDGDNEAISILRMSDHRSLEENKAAYMSFLKDHEAEVEATLFECNANFIS